MLSLRMVPVALRRLLARRPWIHWVVVAVAATATAITFGDEPEVPYRADDAIATSRTVDLAIRADRTLWQRIRWRLSLRSLRKATRSPVIA